MRTSSALLLLALGGCEQASAPKRGDSIECALDGAAGFAAVCTAERVGAAIVVHRPDGGFRRIVRTAEGAATDGADAVTRVDGGTVTIGTDRYRLP